ncbi:MAG: aminotransferase class I/II-fold pyridoxal phosphate-dependent enzyme, partial [Promethearchaeota archaeon]
MSMRDLSNMRDFLLERYFAKYEFQAPYLLSSSDCETMSIKELLDLDPENHAHFNALPLGYTESEGSPLLRSEIANLYQNQDIENILCFAGAEEGIFILMNCLLNPGDHIIVQYPAYQSLFEIARTIGCEITKWMVTENNSKWVFETDNLESMIRPSTKLIIINQPHNPTGALISLNQLNKIVELVQQNNLFLFSDEVYRGLEYNPENRLPAACDLSKRAFSLGVMSKAYGLAGLRIGWITTQDNEILSKMKSLKDYTTICNSAPSEFLATVALQNQDHLINRNMQIITSNLELLNQFF